VVNQDYGLTTGQFAGLDFTSHTFHRGLKKKLNLFNGVLIHLLHYLLETPSQHLLPATVQVPRAREVFNSLVIFIMKTLVENFVFWELRSHTYARLSLHYYNSNISG